MPSLLFVGYATIDYIGNTPHRGGAAALMAANAATLGATAALAAVFARGTKDGRWYLDELQKKGVSTQYSFTGAPGMPTCIIPDNDTLGSKRLWSDNGANRHLEKVRVSGVARFDAVVCANANPILVKRLLTKKPKHFFYIPGPQVVAHPDVLVTEALAYTTTLFLNDEEFRSVTQRVSFARHPQMIVVHTQGAAGGEVLAGGTRHPFTPQPVKKVVNLTGAGDAFALGFIIQWLKTKSIENAISYGILLASQVISKQGGLL